LPCLSRKI